MLPLQELNPARSHDQKRASFAKGSEVSLGQRLKSVPGLERRYKTLPNWVFHVNIQISSVSPLKTEQPWWKKIMFILAMLCMGAILFIGAMMLFVGASWPWLWQWHQTPTPRPRTPGQWTYKGVIFIIFSLFRRKGSGRLAEDPQRCLPQLHCRQGEGEGSSEGRADEWIWRWSSLSDQLLGPHTCQWLRQCLCRVRRKVEGWRGWAWKRADGRMFSGKVLISFLHMDIAHGLLIIFAVSSECSLGGWFDHLGWSGAKHLGSSPQERNMCQLAPHQEPCCSLWHWHIIGRSSLETVQLHPACKPQVSTLSYAKSDACFLEMSGALTRRIAKRV